VTQVAKVGAFFLAGLVLTGFLILKIQDIHIGKAKGAGAVDVHFKDVAGLDDKSAVRSGGGVTEMAQVAYFPGDSEIPALAHDLA